MEYKIKAEKVYMGIPIQAECPEEKLEIFLGNKKLYEFLVPVCADAEHVKYDYISYLRIDQYEGRELTLKGDFDASFFENICQSDSGDREKLTRPMIHFTADRGWINDPNGLVYHNGMYHLYFQYNPMNTQWQNMSWGHAASSDLLHFKQLDTVMYPDESGAVYSGCGIVNEKGMLGLPEDALLFYYSAAGGINPWSEGTAFTQKIAYSTDEGTTLTKIPDPTIGVIRQDSRDPKVFWHEESSAYIMVLWIQGNEFGFFRSENLKDWKKTDSIILPEAWECPDLYRLDCEGEKVWVFTSADGFYYIGEFDGYTFSTDGVQKKAYRTKLPYAAQSYSGVQDRVIAVPWLRTLNKGRLYTGMMGIPRELKLVKRGDEKILSMLPVREYEETKEKITEFNWNDGEFSVEIREDAVAEVELYPQAEGTFTVCIYGQELTIGSREIRYGSETTTLEEPLKEIHIIVDREVIEIHGNHGTENAYYETCSDQLHGKISMKGCAGMGRIYIWQP